MALVGGKPAPVRVIGPGAIAVSTNLNMRHLLAPDAAA
jgi:hypothetical protein